MLLSLEWRPASWEDVESTPARVLRLYMAYKAGLSQRDDPVAKAKAAFGTIGGVPVGRQDGD